LASPSPGKSGKTIPARQRGHLYDWLSTGTHGKRCA
jgi:hypothetical protein